MHWTESKFMAFSAAALLAGLCALLQIGAQEPKPDTDTTGRKAHPGFSVPTSLADPSLRHELTVCVPARIHSERTDTTVSVAVDVASMRSVRVTAGQNMVMGTKTELMVYPAGVTAPSRPGRIELSSRAGFCAVDGKPPSSPASTTILNRSQDGIPRPGKKYFLEMIITIFETDVPP